MTKVALLAGLLAAAACGPEGALTGAPTAIPPLSNDPGAPTATADPTATPRPITRDLDYQDFKLIRWAEFTPVDHAERLGLQAQVTENPRLSIGNLDSIKPVSFTENIYADGTAVSMYCLTNVNCIPRFAIKEETDHGQIPLVIWELIVSSASGSNVRAAFITAHEPRAEVFRDAQLRYLREIGEGQQTISVHLITDIATAESEIWKTVLAYSPDSENLAAWIVQQQEDDPIVLATAIIGR